jgi:hypothetical protein
MCWIVDIRLSGCVRPDTVMSHDVFQCDGENNTNYSYNFLFDRPCLAQMVSLLKKPFEKAPLLGKALSSTVAE